MNMFSVHAIFSSLQGEGRNHGRPATFIRLANCNLACSWCDTHKNEREVLSQNELLSRVSAFKNQSVILTGGEPTIQHGLEDLAQALRDEGRWVALETNGLKKLEHPDAFNYISVSPKSIYHTRYVEGTMLRKADEVRIVAVTDEIAPFCAEMRRLIQATDYYISPLELDGRMHYHRAMKLLEKVNRATPTPFPPWSLSIQMHKVLGIR